MITRADQLERDIEYARERFMYSPTPAQRRAWLKTYEALVRRREADAKLPASDELEGVR